MVQYTKKSSPHLSILWLSCESITPSFTTGHFGWYTTPYSFRLNQLLCGLFQFLLSFLAPSSLSAITFNLSFFIFSLSHPLQWHRCSLAIWASDDVIIDSLYTHHFVVLLYISPGFCKLFLTSMLNLPLFISKSNFSMLLLWLFWSSTLLELVIVQKYFLYQFGISHATWFSVLQSGFQ